jgi:tetrapyrrole methylase family protein/MazG family protein
MKSFEKLIGTMRKLRSPKGCPWDRKQTHQTLLKYLDEETLEVKKAVKKRDWVNLEEELGDVLLQILFHAQIAQEKKRFTIEDVVKTLDRKLRLRHPHVFGYMKEHKQLLKGRSLKTEKDVLASWALLKTLKVKGK